MTTEAPQQLMQQALKGNPLALKKLFAEADQLLAAQDHGGAAAMFKESAICYRIALFRERAKVEEYEQRVSQLETKLAFKSMLLAKPSSYFEVFCPPDANLSFENLVRVWQELEWNEDISAAAMCLTDLWLSQGVQFSSPGGSVDRLIINSVRNILQLERDNPQPASQERPSEYQMIIAPFVHAMVALLTPAEPGNLTKAGL